MDCLGFGLNGIGLEEVWAPLLMMTTSFLDPRTENSTIWRSNKQTLKTRAANLISCGAFPKPSLKRPRQSL